MNTIQISSQDIKSFIEIMKIFKTDTVLITSGTTCMTSDASFSYVKMTETNIPFLNTGITCYGMSDISSYILSNKNLHSVHMDEYRNLYVYTNGESSPYIIMNLTIPPVAFHRFNQCANLLVSPPSLNCGDIVNDIGIQQVLSSLSADGITMYRKDKYMMSLYKGLLPINKSDTVSLAIHDDIVADGQEPMYFTSIFTITKKKKIVINIFLKYTFI